MSVAKAESVISDSIHSDEVLLSGIGLESLEPLLPALQKMSRLRRLRIDNNQITALPDDLSQLSHLEELDLAGNPISGLSAVIRGLFCLTKLKHLNVDLPFETDEDEVIVSLHSLESFNGTSLVETAEGEQLNSVQPTAHTDPHATNTISQPTIGSSDVHSAVPDPQFGSKFAAATAASEAVAAASAKTRWDDSDMSQVHRLYQAANSVSNRVVNRSEFDEYTRNVVAHLQTLLGGEDDPFRREAEILKAKKIMFEYCFEEIARSAHRFDPNLSHVISVLQETYDNLIGSHERLFKTALDDRSVKLEAMKSDMQQAISEIEQLMGQVDGRVGPSSRAQYETERRKFNEELGWLRAENEKLQTRLRQVETSRGQNVTPGRPGTRQSLTVSLGRATSTGTAQNGTSVTPNRGKVLTLRQLRDVVEDIYASKSKYDIKCAETHLPRETMEQHMYTYLNQRYGLKHLILEWATAIIQGVKKYSTDDNDVAVFGKILRNEIDEEFRFVQRQLKETVHELLRVYLKGKHPLKGDDEVTQMLRKRTSSMIFEEEWVDIVKYMYNTEDSVSIIMRINDVVKQREAPAARRAARRAAMAGSQTGRHTSSNSDSLKELPFTEFIRILLDFQLEGHERFLAKFVRIFKTYDADRNGVINEHEFRQVLKSVDGSKTDEEVNALLDLIDPHNNQLINFSECVTFLSSELVRMMREEAVPTPGQN